MVYGFQGAEWRMTACPSPETASLLVKASGAEVVVIASRTEHEKTYSLLRQLRAKEAYRALPVLVLGPEDLRQPLKDGGGADLLPLPTFVRDVVTASELLVTAGTATAQQPGEDPCFQSATTGVKTLSLVRTMNGLASSGILRLERNGRTGEIMFAQGELTAAAIGALQGMAAVQHLMIWNDGKLELRLRQVPRRGQLHQTAQEFLQELDRFQRDFVHGMKGLGSGTTLYSANQERLKQAGAAVPAEVTPVVRLCNGSRTLADIIDESPFRVLDTVRILGRLAELSVLTRADGKPVASSASQTAGDVFLDTARITGATSAWPMPAPIGAPASSAPIFNTPVPPTQPPQGQAVSPLQAPPMEPSKSAPPSASPAPPEAEARPRRQTLELGVPPVAPSSPAPTTQPAATSQAPAAPAPAAPAKQASAVVAPAPAAQLPAAKPGAPVVPQSPFPLATGEADSPAKAAAAAPVALAAATSIRAAVAAAAAAATAPQAVQASGAHSASPTAPAPIAPAVAQTSGIIESRPNARRTQPTMHAVGVRRSVVIEAIQTEDVSTPVPASPIATAARQIVVPVVHTVPAASPTSPPAQTAAPAAQPTPAASGSAPVVGVLHVTPSRRTAAQVIPTDRISIQLDASLSTPAPVAPAGPANKSDSPGARVTGEMHVAPSGRTTRAMGKAAPKVSSFHVDPSLSEPAPQVQRRSDSQPVPQKRTDSRPVPGRTDSRPVPLRRSDSRPTPGPKRHQSGSFSTVEADFFAREADLYKEEKAESFADLDDGKAKPGAKGKGKGGKPGRPYRK